MGYSGPDRIYGSTCSQHAAFSTSSPSPLSTTPNVKALARWTAGKRFTYRLLRTQTTPYTPVTLCLRVRKFAYILSCIFCCCCSVYILEVHTWYVFSSEISPPRMPLALVQQYLLECHIIYSLIKNIFGIMTAVNSGREGGHGQFFCSGPRTGAR